MARAGGIGWYSENVHKLEEASGNSVDLGEALGDYVNGKKAILNDDQMYDERKAAEND